MDIAAHQLRCGECLTEGEATAHGECLVHTHQPFNPRIDEQVVPNTYLNRCWIACIHKQHIKKSGIEHNITVIADKSVTTLWGGSPFECTIVEDTTISVFTHDILHDGFHEAFLEIERCLDTKKSQAQ